MSIIKNFFSRMNNNKIHKVKYKNTFRITFNCNYFTKDDFQQLEDFINKINVKKPDYISFNLTNTEIKSVTSYGEIEGSKYNIELNELNPIKEFIANYKETQYKNNL